MSLNTPSLSKTHKGLTLSYRGPRAPDLRLFQEEVESEILTNVELWFLLAHADRS